MKAIWNNRVIAEAKETLMLEGKHYFPQGSVKLEYLNPSDYCEECPVKGLANYYNLEDDCEQVPNAAWYYPNPKEAAVQIMGYIAFGEGIKIVE